MTLTSYILIDSEPGKEHELRKKLKTLTGVDRVDLVYGEHDMMVHVTTKDSQTLDEFVFNTLRRIPSINGTKTLIIANVSD